MLKGREEKLWDARFRKALGSVAPGTPLREGLENILRAKMGALVVVGDGAEILDIVDGGFALNCDFTPTGFYELAKMDGAIILSGDAKKVLYANAQLVPDHSIFTAETGTRHRTAERVAKQTGALVISISERRNIITLYLGNLRYILRDIIVMLNRVNHALQTLEKYKRVLTRGLTTLSALEFEDLVTLGDVADVLIRAERFSRIAKEIEHSIVELGSEGRLVSRQMEELVPENDEVHLLIRDYCTAGDLKSCDAVREQIASVPEESLDPYNVCRLLGFGAASNAIDVPVIPRGYRLLRRVPRLPAAVQDNLVARFKTLPRIYGATLAELDEVEGIGEIRAKTIKDGLKRLREQALLDRHL